MPFNLRKATEADMPAYFNLKNEQGVRESAFDSKPVDIEMHRSWFLKKLKDPNSFLFVIDVDGNFAGQMRLGVEEDHVETDIALAPEYRGKGYAPLAIVESLRTVFAERPEVKIIYAHIKPGNVGSEKSFEKAGFSYNGTVDYEGNLCTEMILKRPN